VHPSQVQIVNAAFTPTVAELAQARQAVDAFEAALKRGEGAISVDGMMIDAPVAARAKRILQRSQRTSQAPGACKAEDIRS
jgi:citrate lyase subunit beta/citryl-CoA lyase